MVQRFGTILCSPHTRKVENFIKTTEWGLALGELFGILAFTVYDDKLWISDSEVEEGVVEWFADYSKNWETVMGQTDKVLGLYDVKYRVEMRSMFQEFRKYANEALYEFYDAKSKTVVKSW